MASLVFVHMWLTSECLERTSNRSPKLMSFWPVKEYTVLLLNGLPTLVNQSGVKVRTDERGSLSLTNPTDDISSEKFTVIQVLDHDVKGKSYTVDPQEKIVKRLSSIQTVDNLRNQELVVWNNPSKYGVGSEALHLVKVSLFLGIIIE